MLEYTDTKLDKIKFEYCPKRLKDSEYWCEPNQDFQKMPPLETDEEVEETLRFIENLEVLKIEHRLKGAEKLDIIQPYEEHIYELHINSYHELLKIINVKSCHSSVVMTIDTEFKLKNYDYSELDNIFIGYQHTNNMWLYITGEKIKNFITV